MDLVRKIENHEAKIGVIGLGYVGLPLVIEFCRNGFPVIGFDVDAEKVKILNEGRSYIKHIDLSSAGEALDRFDPTTDFSRLEDVDCILICVPTPLNKYREPDLSYVLETTEVIAKHLRKGQLVVLESTTYPGTTDEDMRAILERGGMKGGEDFYLAYSPEREDPNNPEFSTGTIPKVVGGYTPDCLKAADALYGQIVVKTVPVSSTRAAEAAKLLENIYRAVNIAMVNELKVLFDRMDIDIWEVIEAAKTKPFGFQAFYPGPGLGGHCIPIDPFYLTWKAREFEMHTRFIELAGEVNTSMPYYVVQKTMEALNQKKKSINGAKILILGLAYKKDIDDVRESPAFKLMELFIEKGAQVDYNDPLVKETPRMRNYDIKRESVELTEGNLKKCDCLVIATDHSVYEAEHITKYAELIVDTRNLIKDAANYPHKVVRA